MKKICIVTTRHISYNPRVLKEADAFFKSGYEVTVVTVNNHQLQHEFDEKLMTTRKWKLRTINFRKGIKEERGLWLYLSILQLTYIKLSRLSLKFGIAERAALKGYKPLLKLAVSQKADFYLVHHPEALSIGYHAAKAQGVGFGFDAEDFHTGMSENGVLSADDKIIGFLEARYLPHCRFITAASNGIGAAYKAKYRIPDSHTVLNVFPTVSTAVCTTAGPVRFYWYSQIIGPNRSLELLVQAAAKLNAAFEVHLRGSFHSDAYKNSLLQLIATCGLAKKVFFHSPILAEKIIPDAAQYDVGLALETDVSVNRNICVTNKVFSYLMSGLAVVGTDTAGQANIFKSFEKAVQLCGINDADGLAKAMLFYIEHPAELQAAKQAAKAAALQRFNWEYESEIFLKAFENQTLVTKKKLEPTLP